MFKIIKLVDEKSQYIPVIHQWLMNWWGKEEGFSDEKMKTYIKHSLCENKLPQTFLMIDNEKSPVGMYQFSYSDLDIRPNIYPWLINVYIDEKYRGKGLSKILINSVKEKAKDNAIKTLYLYTNHIGLYEKYGFSYIESFNTFISGENDIKRLYSMDL